MLITDTTQRLGMNTMTHLFLQTFFCGDWYGKSITDELEWVVKELTYEEPDKKTDDGVKDRIMSRWIRPE